MAEASPEGEDRVEAAAGGGEASPGGLAANPAAVIGVLSLLAVILFGMGAALFSQIAPIYLLRLPENYDERVAVAIADGDAPRAVAAIDGELTQHPYNFAAVFAFAQRALSAPDQLRKSLGRAALDRIGLAFASFEAVRYRDVYTSGWSEGEALRLTSELLGLFGLRAEQASVWEAAVDADPAWTNAARSFAGVDAASIIAGGSPRAENAVGDRPDTSLLFGRGDYDMAFVDSLRAQLLDDGSAVAFYGRGSIDLPHSSTRDLDAPRLMLVARGSEALGGWPYLLVEAIAADDDSSPRLLGVVHINQPGWSEFGVRLAQPIRRGDTVRLSYYNDAYDAETGADRNVWIKWVALDHSSDSQ